MVPKIVKMVDMFLNELININSSVCSPGQYATTVNHAHLGLENKNETDIGFRQFERMDESMANIARHSTTDPPVHTFVVTRQYRVSRRTFIPKRLKDDEDDDDADPDDTVLQKTGHDDGNQRGNVGTANPKAPNHEVHRHRLQHHHHRHHGYLENNEYRGSDISYEIDAEDEFGRRHRLKLGKQSL